MILFNSVLLRKVPYTLQLGTCAQLFISNRCFMLLFPSCLLRNDIIYGLQFYSIPWSFNLKNMGSLSLLAGPVLLPNPLCNSCCIQIAKTGVQRLWKGELLAPTFPWHVRGTPQGATVCDVMWTCTTIDYWPIGMANHNISAWNLGVIFLKVK